MKILDAGHIYSLDTFDGDPKDKQQLVFMKRYGDNFPFNNNSFSGTNCQEVLRALIDRCEFLYKQKPCLETESIIGLLKTALLLFESRAARLHGLPIDLDNNTLNNTCKICGHVTCEHNNGNKSNIIMASNSN